MIRVHKKLVQSPNTHNYKKKKKKTRVITSLTPHLVFLCLTWVGLACRWWSKETVAIVTGANKGIGLGMVKRLAELGVTVILTARDEARGILAVHSLSSQGLHVHFSILDVSDPLSIQSFASWFQHTFGKLDILVSIYTTIPSSTLSLSLSLY